MFGFCAEQPMSAQLVPSFALFGFAGVWLTQSFWATVGIAATIVGAFQICLGLTVFDFAVAAFSERALL